MAELKLDNRIPYSSDLDLYGRLETVSIQEKPHEVHSLIALKRYETLTREGVISYLQSVEARAEDEHPSILEPVGNQLEYLVSQLPQEVRMEIRQGEGETVDHLVNSYGVTPSTTQHFLVECSYIPLSILDKSSQQIKDYDGMLKESLSEEGMSVQFILDLTLTKQGLLPEKDIVDFYVSRGVWHAPELSVSSATPSYDREQVKRIIDELYKVFSSKDEICKVTDLSEKTTDSVMRSLLSQFLPPMMIIAPFDDFSPEDSGGETLH